MQRDKGITEKRDKIVVITEKLMLACKGREDASAALVVMASSVAWTVAGAKGVEDKAGMERLANVAYSAIGSVFAAADEIVRKRKQTAGVS